ncbi:diguanylate cyclase (GGDEF)-like protein [Skermanella aerolata]|uniref:sensor domain-containing diguanylate cyclase n=1 Tax=Skermanella aerolata TaxID=393310 RepID=UPI003D2403A5
MVWKRKGFRGLVAFVSAALVVGMAGLMAQATSERSRRQIEQEIGRSLSEVAHQMVDKLDTDMWARANQVSVLSKIPAVRDPAVAQKVVDELKARDPTVAWVGVMDFAGRIVAASDGILIGVDASARPVYVEGLKGLFIGDVHDAVLLAKMLPNPSGEPMKFVDVSAPLKDEQGTVVGTLASHFSWEWARAIQRSLLESMKGRPGLEALIVGADGTVLLGPEGSFGGKLDLESIRLARGRHRGWGVEEWPDGKSYLTGVAFGSGHGDYQGLGWTVLARQPVDVAFAPAELLREDILIYGGIFAVVFSILAWIAAGWITRPLSAIASAAKRLRDGEPGVEIPALGGVAEVEDLSQSLRALIGALTSSKAALARMEDAAYQDRLTALPNRRFLEQYAESLSNRPGRGIFTVLYMDLDGFKSVNDTLGHQAGDIVLRQVAVRLASCLRGEDLVARLGGDEFAAIIVPAASGMPARMDEITQRLIAAVGEPIVIAGRAVRVGCSIGFAEWPNHGATLPDVLERADRALYAAKRLGKNRAVAFADLEAGLLDAGAQVATGCSGRTLGLAAFP